MTASSAEELRSENESRKQDKSRVQNAEDGEKSGNEIKNSPEKSHTISKRNVIKDLNPLRIGLASLQELEEMVKSYRIMNNSCLKRRYIMSREVFKDEDDFPYLEKGEDIGVAHLKKMRKTESGHFLTKIFLPDEGIVNISDQTTAEGKQLEQMIYHHLMRMGNKAYEGFLDRLASIHDLLNLFVSTLFPKLIIIGVVQTDLLEMERINLKRMNRLDPYIRFIEVTHFKLKPFPLFPGIKCIHISEESEEEWNRFLEEIVVEYTKPYFVED